MPKEKKLGDIEVVDANKIKAVEEMSYDKLDLQQQIQELNNQINTEKQNKQTLTDETNSRVEKMNVQIAKLQAQKEIIQNKLGYFK